MSLGAGSSKSGKAKLFTQKRTQTPFQQEAQLKGGRSILEESLAGGFTPEEASSDFARRADPINRAFKTSTGDLSRLLGRSGLSGGTATTDFSTLLSERIRGIGAAAGATAEASTSAAEKRKERLLQFLSLAPQALVGGGGGSGKEFSVGI